MAIAHETSQMILGYREVRFHIYVCIYTPIYTHDIHIHTYVCMCVYARVRACTRTYAVPQCVVS